MHKLIFSLCLVGCLAVGQAYAQCRSVEAWEESWASCQTSPSPNAARGNSHWLAYDFGYAYPLKDFYIWNANQTAHLTRGVKRMSLDYSEDGVNWQEWGEFDVPQGPGNSYYSGDKIAELEGLVARHVLLTFTESWGDPACVSLHEVVFNLDSNIPLGIDESLRIFPNPVRDEVKLMFELNSGGRVDCRLLNLTGQTVMYRKEWLSKGPHTLEVNTASLNDGLYLVQILEEGESLIGVGKLVVLH